MLVGILAMMAFHVVDTFFVSRLGTDALAAITLTFPVVMVVGMFTLGLGVGAMAVISQGIGAGERASIRRSATDAILLAGACVAVLTVVGFATFGPLFRMLGATEELLPLIRQYMLVWYGGMVFYIIPVIGNNIIRATGDTVTPSVVMIVGVLINAVLDPLLIFGWGVIPGMGMAGAAIATVIARGTTLVVVLWILHLREHLLDLSWCGWASLLQSWRRLLRTGLPVAVSNAIIPVAVGIITRIVTRFGTETVAGFGVATRIEGFGMALVYALSSGMSPFVGQNFGAGRIDRIQKGLSYVKAFCLAWGVLLLAVFLLLGKRFAACFDRDPAVVRAASLYLWIVSASLGLRGIHQVIWTALNVLNRPYDSLFLEFLLAFGLSAPLAIAGAHIAEIAGVYCGLSLANILAGIVAYIWVDRVVRREKDKTCSVA